MKVSCKLLFVSAFLVGFTALFAQQITNPATMTAYKSALSDLRGARAYLESFGPTNQVNNQEMHAMTELDNAMREIEKAGVQDNKSLQKPTIAKDMSKKDRYTKALSLAQTAYSTVSSNPTGDPTRDKHIKDHISEASETMKAIVKEMK